MRSFFKKLLGDSTQRELDELRAIVNDVNNLEPDVQRLSDEQLRSEFQDLGARYRAGESLDDLLPESFAITRETAGEYPRERAAGHLAAFTEALVGQSSDELRNLAPQLASWAFVQP